MSLATAQALASVAYYDKCVEVCLSKDLQLYIISNVAGDCSIQHQQIYSRARHRTNDTGAQRKEIQTNLHTVGFEMRISKH